MPRDDERAAGHLCLAGRRAGLGDGPLGAGAAHSGILARHDRDRVRSAVLAAVPLAPRAATARRAGSAAPRRCARRARHRRWSASARRRPAPGKAGILATILQVDAAAAAGLRAQHRDELPRDGDRHRGRRAARARRRSRCCRRCAARPGSSRSSSATRRGWCCCSTACCCCRSRCSDRRHVIPLPGWVKSTIGLSLPVMANVVGARARRGALDPVPANGRRRSRSPSRAAQTLWMIILPQCVKRMMPPWMNLYAILTVATPLTSVVGVQRGDDPDRRQPRRPKAAPSCWCRCISICCCGSSSIAIRSRARRVALERRFAVRR